ncbi:hypothetical protein [Kocuria aegyptia]|uniref:hypothetical protein n=1 Tax=Kocuria aegyptia TaxID=330943 RepID=UPI0031CF3427
MDAVTVRSLQRSVGNRSVQRLPRLYASTAPAVGTYGPVIQRDDTSEITRMSITAEYTKGLTPDQLVERLRLVQIEMNLLDRRGERQSLVYSTLYTNRRLLRDALGDAGRTAEQEMVASLYKMPLLSAPDSAKLRLAIGGSRAWEALEHRNSLVRSFHHNQRRGMGIANFTVESRDRRALADEALNRELAALGMSSPQQLVELMTVQLPTMVLQRAKLVALGMLDQNEEAVQHELERYGPAADLRDVAGLQAADHELLQREEKIRSLSARIDSLENRQQRNSSRGMGIANFTTSNIQEAAAVGEQLEIARSEAKQVLAQYSLRFPVLGATEYRPGMFAGLTPQQAAARTAAPLNRVLSNIAKVRKEIQADELKVWNINRAISVAMLEMGIAGQPHMARAVQKWIERRAMDEAFKALVLAATAILTTVLSGPFAPFVGAAWGGYFAAKGINQYVTEVAAENVALDPEVRDISANEPSLLWLVVDIVGAVIDLGGILRALRPVARAAMASGKIADFARLARRLVPEAAERLLMSLRRRLRGAEAASDVATGARGVSGANRTLAQYLDALRQEARAPGTMPGRWDHANQPRGLPNSQWEPGMPMDMPNTAGNYPTYDIARPRYWRNRAHAELQARQSGAATHVPGNTTDPVKGLTNPQLTDMMSSGRAPRYAFPNTPGQTWELEHGIPQRVGSALVDLGLSRADAARLSRASDPHNLMEVTPLEHSFHDAEAHGFGSLRGDRAGDLWGGTRAADSRLQNSLRDMSDADLITLIDRTRGMDFTRTARTRQLLADIRAACTGRRLPVTPP